MQRICKDTHICHAILRGKSNLHLFQDEIEKMKVLDAARKSKEDIPIQVLAYCVVRGELHLLVKEQAEGEKEEFLAKVKENYLEMMAQRYQDKSTDIFRRDEIRELAGERSAVLLCRRLHLLPMKYMMAGKPEDYWWCSYPDYLGRKWLELTDTAWLLYQYDAKPRKAVQLIRKDYQQYMERQKEKLQ